MHIFRNPRIFNMGNSDHNNFPHPAFTGEPIGRSVNIP